MYAEVAWVLVTSGTQVQPQVVLDSDYLPDYLSVSYDYGANVNSFVFYTTFAKYILRVLFARFLGTFIGFSVVILDLV